MIQTIDKGIMEKTFELVSGHSVSLDRNETIRLEQVGKLINKELKDYVTNGKVGNILRTYRPDLII